MNLLKELLRQMDTTDRALACRVIDAVWSGNEESAVAHLRAMTPRGRALFDLAPRWNRFECHEEGTNGTNQN